MKLVATLAGVISLMLAANVSRAAEANTFPVTIGSAQVAKWVGKQIVVTGVVAQVSIRPSLVFLNFDKPYSNNLFTAIIRNRNTDEFESLPALRGKVVSVKGQVRNYNGKPEMEPTGKSQLKVLDNTK